MKRIIIILAMFMIAATAYNQTSRRSANSSGSTENKTSRSRTTQTGSNSNTNNKTNARGTNSSSTRSESSATRGRSTTTTQSGQTQSRNSSSTSRERTTTTTSQRNETHSRPATTTRSQTGNQTTTNRVRTVDRTNYHVEHTRTTTARQPHAEVRHVHSSPRVYREKHTVVHHYQHAPETRVYRAKHYAYRAPVELQIVWTPRMHRHYTRMYPSVGYWHYSHGYHIEMVSSYFADYYIGEVMTVYGKVSEVYYSHATDEYFLYYGPYYPYQDFTIVISGNIARRYSHRPGWFFENKELAVTGLITSFEGQPEIVVREPFQINLY